MKNKTRKPEIDCDSPVVENTVETPDIYEAIESIEDFERYCNKKGVTINIQEFYKDYTEEKYTAPVIAYTWWKAKNNEVGGRYDIQKRKRRVNA